MNHHDRAAWAAATMGDLGGLLVRWPRGALRDLPAPCWSLPAR